MAVQTEIQLTDDIIRSAIISGAHDGLGQQAIAEKFGHNKTWLNYWLKKLKLSWRDLKKEQIQKESSTVQIVQIPAKIQSSKGQFRVKRSSRRKSRPPQISTETPFNFNQIEEMEGDPISLLTVLNSDQKEILHDHLQDEFIDQQREIQIKEITDQVDKLDPPIYIKKLLNMSIQEYKNNPSPQWHNAIFKTLADIEKGLLADVGRQKDGSFVFRYHMSKTDYNIVKAVDLDFDRFCRVAFEQFKGQNAEALKEWLSK